MTIELRRLGHEAYSCDIEPCSGCHPEWHLQQDVTPLLREKWDMIIAFPPCTYLSNAGARHLYRGNQLNNERYERGVKARDFFLSFFTADCEKVAIENPTPSKIFGLPMPTQIIQPYQFGHPYKKRTCLWLKNMPLLFYTDVLSGDFQSTKIPGNWFNAGGNERQKNRSKTFPGIARAMAEQWAGPNQTEQEGLS